VRRSAFLPDAVDVLHAAPEPLRPLSAAEREELRRNVRTCGMDANGHPVWGYAVRHGQRPADPEDLHEELADPEGFVLP